MSEASVAVAGFDNGVEASLACGLLREAGLRPTVADEELGLSFLHGRACARVLVKVPAAEASLARAALASPSPTPVRDDSAHALALRVRHAAVAGLLFPPFMLYAIWLVIALLRHDGELGRAERRAVVLTVALTLLFVAAATFAMLA